MLLITIIMTNYMLLCSKIRFVLVILLYVVLVLFFVTKLYKYYHQIIISIFIINYLICFYTFFNLFKRKTNEVYLIENKNLKLIFVILFFVIYLIHNILIYSIL